MTPNKQKPEQHNSRSGFVVFFGYSFAAYIRFIFSTLSSSIAFVACKYFLLVTSIVLHKYEEMCLDFPQYLSEPYKAEDFFTDVAASAFVNGDKYGVLVDSNIALPLEEIIMTFLHEIAHLFCTKNEVSGGAFFEKYCSGTGTLDGMINAGYAIWREAIADITADAATASSFVKKSSFTLF